MTTTKEADLAALGIGNYQELERILPRDYEPLQTPRQTMEALYGAKRLIEDRLCEELNLTMVQVPLIVGWSRELSLGRAQVVDSVLEGSDVPVLLVPVRIRAATAERST